MTDRISANEVAIELQNINDDRGAELIAADAVNLALACIAVILRFLSRRTSKAAIQADDWTIVAALVRHTRSV